MTFFSLANSTSIGLASTVLASQSTSTSSYDCVVLGETYLTLDAMATVAREHVPVAVSEISTPVMAASRRVIEDIVAGGEGDRAVYGVNTGFGGNAQKRIPAAELAELQVNLVRSHAAGVGAPLRTDQVRAMMLLRAAVLALGHSGTRPRVCDLLCDMLNKGVHPVIPSKGSVGASGDLAPLAHMALVLIGEGQAEYEGQILTGAAALKAAALSPLNLAAKEGLTLLNGTQFMTAVGGLAVYDAQMTANLADIAGAMSLEAYQGTNSAFDPRIHHLKQHPGQMTSAAFLTRLLLGSKIITSHADCDKVQDPYSFRCMPQVHGATRDALTHVQQVLERETRSVTDNPLVFANSGEVISGGNFHGQPIALALDYAGIALAELANISERRIEQLVNGRYASGLPPFLAPDPGTSSGFMIAHVTATALVSENKGLAHPASVDSIPTSAGQEDHVSMGARAAIKLEAIQHNVRDVLAIEFLAAAQGLDFRKPRRTSPALQAVYERIRAEVPFMERDRVMTPDIERVRALIDDGSLLSAAESALGSEAD